METFYKSNDVWENVFKLNFSFNLYETRSLLCSVVMAVLELALQTRVNLNSEVHCLSPKCWIKGIATLGLFSRSLDSLPYPSFPPVSSLSCPLITFYCSLVWL